MFPTALARARFVPRRTPPSIFLACTRTRRLHASRLLQAIRTVDMTEEGLGELKVNRDRLMKTLHQTCAWGTGKRWGSGPNETGMSRLALSDSDKQARDWFAETTTALGCTLTVDAMGNMFAVRPGRRRGPPPTFAGSHLDTQPSGGRYDGILGILAGVEMLRVLQERDVETEHAVGVVNWTNEEGARFPVSMVASGVWAGEVGLEHAHGLREVGGGSGTVRSELERIGYLGSTPASYESVPMGAHFELHIEQGPVLEAHGQKIGVVQGVQAYRWFTVEVQGRDAHTGTTPLCNRADALLLAARCISHSHVLATSHGALASTGILTLEPGSVNTVPGRVRFSLDIRAPGDATLDALEASLNADFASLAAGVAPATNPSALVGSTPGLAAAIGPTVSWRTDSVSPATAFDADCIETVRRAAASVLGGKKQLVRDMTSGAGHDTVYASRRCPASMIFVPCRGGVSHNPQEFATDEDCALGATVLLQSVLRFDRLRATGRLSG